MDILAWDQVVNINLRVPQGVLPHPRSTVPRLNAFCKCLLGKLVRIISVGNCMGQNKIKD